MRTHVILLLALAFLIGLAAAKKTKDFEMLEIDAAEEARDDDDVCRCHASDFRCVLNIGFWSTMWWSVPLGFCNSDLQNKREEFELALNITENPSEWSDALETQIALLKSKTTAFENAVKTDIGTDVDGTSLTAEPTKAEFETMNMGQQVFVMLGTQIKKAKEIMENGRSLTEGKRQELVLTHNLGIAIKGMSIKALEDAMRAANQAGRHVAVPWSLIVQAQTRQDELVELKGKLANSIAKTEEGKRDLEEARAKLNAVKSKMQDIQTIQDDLGDKVQEILKQNNALDADDAIRDSISKMEKEFFADAQGKLDSLKTSAEATITEIGTADGK